jgi:hypothetical protein
VIGKLKTSQFANGEVSQPIHPHAPTPKLILT